MHARSGWLFFIALAGLACSSTGYPDHGSAARHAVADELASAKLERLKGMQGEWTFLGSTEMPQGGQVRYTTVSGGHAVMEELFPGTEHSMVTMYHIERGRLVLSHYCSVGNQPKMACAPGGSPDHLRFECVGGPSYDCKQDMHMHKAAFDFAADGTVEARWESLQGGKPAHGALFDLQRKS